jgi:hypothetical protein
MKNFIQLNEKKVQGMLSCFDRMIFRGYLPIQSGWQMAGFLNRQLGRGNLKEFLTETGYALKAHALKLAKEAGRPYRYLERKIPMEREAREMAQRDGIDEGLVCIFAILQPCRTFSFRYQIGQPFCQRATRKCLHLYYYFMDREFGLIHVKVQTWFPMTMQVYVNGQDWLARKLSAEGIGYTKVDNVFLHVADFERAQVLADRLPSLKWPRILDRWTKRVQPLLAGILKEMSYYWVTTQSEYATDVVFRSRRALQELYPRLLSHGMLCFGAKEVMGFLGRKLVGQFRGEIVTDLLELGLQRLPGARIKHRVKENWLKMYDKVGMVLRVETVINSPEEFRVRRRVQRKGDSRMEWAPLRKGVAYLFRYRDVSLSSNSRYLDALSVVSDPSTRVRELDRLTRRKQVTPARAARALNPLSKEDIELFRAVMNGEHNLSGFRNRDLRRYLLRSIWFQGIRGDERKQSAKVTRMLQRLHGHGLIAKIPRSRKWRTTRLGRRLMATSIHIRALSFPQLLALEA